MALSPFHLAIPVHDLAAARAFYGGLFGHQLVAHLDRSRRAHVQTTNAVDGHEVPVPHFGVVLSWQAWQALAERLSKAGQRFVIEPGIRFQRQAGEEATFFLYD